MTGLYATSMKCLECGREYGLDEAISTCPTCDGLVDVTYDYTRILEAVERQELRTRRVNSIWRYAELLPIPAGGAITLGEGCTPLVKAENLGHAIDLRNLYVKLDFTCPTGSFKDRGASVMISKAKHLRMKAVAIDSSGNAAAAIAGYAAKAGLRCYVFAPSYASEAKLIQSLAYGATVYAIDGTRRETYQTAKEAYQHFGWYYCGFQTNPYAVEGTKTVAYEICEQLAWTPPDHVVFPVGSSSNLVGCWKGLKELHRLGWIPRLPSLACIQSEGCAPIAAAYKTGSMTIIPVEHPKTVAEGLMISHPLKGNLALQALSETEGSAEIVTDAEILQAGKLLAKREGLFVEPSTAVAIAGVRKLAEAGLIAKDELVVCVLTGSGLKTREAYSKLVGRPTTVKPGLEALKAIMRRQS
jgi:threonine synthase